MPQLSYLQKVLITHFPTPIPQWVSRGFTRVMVEYIRRLEIVGSERLELNGKDLRLIRLRSGISLIGHSANATESKILGEIAKEKGLDPSYAKILLDAITRYTLAHASGPCGKMEFPKDERYLFHPQHVNFILEEERVPAEKRKELASHFHPKTGWHCLDIGAFLGHGATWLREQIGESGRIICVEASESNKVILNEQMRRNAFDNVTCKYAAIWHTAGDTVTFNTTERQGNAIDAQVVDGTGTIDVPTVSIESLTNELGQAADLVSLTVNGAEVEALEGIPKMEPHLFPKRIIAPGWYMKDGRPRVEFLKPLYEELGYESFFTEGLLSVAWRD